jgi:hypothetical protein
MEADLAEALEALAKREGQPVAFEAFWDGDTTGWFVVVAAVFYDAAAGCYDLLLLAWLRDAGGDLRIFNAQVPPWPEAKRAALLGEQLSTSYEVPFFFPSPAEPESDCPHWWEQDLASPCSACGVPLLQRDHCPWRGTCYHCHLQRLTSL